jgi:hypothetical protein
VKMKNSVNKNRIREMALEEGREYDVTEISDNFYEALEWEIEKLVTRAVQRAGSFNSRRLSKHHL